MAWYHHTLTYKLYNYISSYIEYRKAKNLVSETIYGKPFAIVLKKYLHMDVRKDWLGRLYGVINPNINRDGQFDISNTIIELDDDNTNSNEYVKSWIFKQLELIKTLFHIEKLYDYLSIDIKHVGPINLDNYLVVFDIFTRKLYARAAKSFWIQLFVYGIIGAGIWYFIW